MSGISSSKPKTVFRLENKFETQARSRLIDFFYQIEVGKVRVLGLRRLGGSASPCLVLQGPRNSADERLIFGTIYQDSALTTNNCHFVITCSMSFNKCVNKIGLKANFPVFSEF